MAKQPKNTDYSAYVGVGHNSADELAEITKLAEAQHAAQIKVESCEEALRTAKEELRIIAEKKLPELMDSLGLANYGTSSGINVQITEKIRASLQADQRPKAFDWLEKNGFGGMIKSEVIVNYKRDELTEANQLVDTILQTGRPATLERKVEPMTLTAWAREQLAQGKEIPLDIFGVFRQRIAKVEV